MKQPPNKRRNQVGYQERRYGVPLIWALIATLLAVIVVQLSITSSASAGYRHFCWGAPVGNNGSCDSLNHDGIATYVDEVGGSGTKHSVCVIVWYDKTVPLMCSGGPNQGVYNYAPKGEIQTPGQISNNANDSNVLYGFMATCPSPCTKSGGGGESEAPPPSPPGPEGKWFFRNTNTTGVADTEFIYGGPELLPVSGDWNGDGIDTPGAYKQSTGQWFLRNSLTPGSADLEFTYGGGAEMVPIAGDWNGDGIDTIGLYKPGPGQYFLRNSNTGGVANIEFTFGGGQNTQAVAGDWNGDGIDTIGTFKPVQSGPDQWFLKNGNFSGVADVEFTYGSGTEMLPVVGDWDGNGTDTPGLYKRTAEWFLRNSNSTGVANLEFLYGGSIGSKPIAGDWNNDGVDTIGMVR